MWACSYVVCQFWQWARALTSELYASRSVPPVAVVAHSYFNRTLILPFASVQPSLNPYRCPKAISTIVQKHCARCNRSMTLRRYISWALSIVLTSEFEPQLCKLQLAAVVSRPATLQKFRLSSHQMSICIPSLSHTATD